VSIEPPERLADDRAECLDEWLVVGTCVEELECERVVLVPNYDVFLGREVAEEGAR
jgi:hypothetical protein